MAVYDDYDGLYFSLQALKMYHPLCEVELIVVDNSPGAESAGPVRALVEGWTNGQRCVHSARYIPMETPGTTQTRQRIFDEAAAPIVLVMDSHVLIAPLAISKLLAWYQAHPSDASLVSGPLLYDDLENMTTHFDDVWRSEMWGTWGQAWECPCGEADATRFSAIEGPEGMTHYRPLTMGQNLLVTGCECGKGIPIVPWAGHQQQLLAAGFKKLGANPEDPPFEVPGMGLGLFACRRDAWLGFNPHFRGFGGEEMYIHEKFRQAGRHCLCLPFLRWNHRFGRVGKPKYRLTRWDKCRNYVLGHQELGLPLDPVHEHFVAGGLVTQEHWDFLIEDPVHREQPPGVSLVHPRRESADVPTIDELFGRFREAPRDLNEHFDVLRAMVADKEVVEFTKRKESTIAFAAGRPKALHTFTSEPDQLHQLLPIAAGKAGYTFDGGLRSVDVNASLTKEIPVCDVLYLDTVHHGDRLQAELDRHAGRVRGRTIIRGTAAFGNEAEGGGRGLFPVMKAWLQEHPDWFVAWHRANQYGMTMLSRLEEDRPDEQISPWPIGFGPGTELTAIIKSLGIEASANCGCRAYAEQMDRWGVQGCLERHHQIAEHLRDQKDKWGWGAKFKAAGHAIFTGLAFKLNPVDPYPGLVREAINRAQRKESTDAE
jgi:hypothetical protein